MEATFFFIHARKIYRFKVKDSEVKLYILFLGNISKGFTANNMKKNKKQKKTGLKMDMPTIFPLFIILLVLVMLSIFISI